MALVVAGTLGTTGAVAQRSAGPDHGLSEETYYTLWSGDEDGDLPNESNGSAADFAAATDVPFNAPPIAVERWNVGDLEDFPATSADTSIHPSTATLHDSVFLKDAYLDVFAVQPSTRARLSPGEAPLYVPPNGTVLGTVDYRVALPSTDADTTWRNLAHEIQSVSLRLDGQTINSTDGTHTPIVAYSGLEGQSGQQHELTLEATITLEAERVTRDSHRHCVYSGQSVSCTTRWTTDIDPVTDQLIVRDSITVTGYDLDVSGYQTTYPNGDRGLVVYKNLPWAGYETPEGDVRGVWAFYSARDPAWDTLVVSTSDGETVQHSPLHPLQVSAYPIETGPTAHGDFRILDVYGDPTMPPTLPPNVTLDVLTDEYTASFGIAVRERRASTAWTDVTVRGLVRGSSINATPDSLAAMSLRRSNLSLAILDQDEETVTVQVTLRDAETNASIATHDREGYVVLNDKRVQTNETGQVTQTLSRSTDAITARYEPGYWWRNLPGYVADSDTVYVRGRYIDLLGALYGIGVPVGLLLIAAFLIDRLTGWPLWPPWRNL